MVKIFKSQEIAEREKMYKELSRYGVIKADFTATDTKYSEQRIMVIALKGKKYWLHLCNGEIVECFEV